MSKIYDLIIIGSGPAGLSAAIYAQRARLETLVIEKEYVSGGQVLNTYEVDNYPGLPAMNGFDLGMKLREHADKLEATFITAEVNHVNIEETVKLVKTEKETYQAKTLIIASGATHRKLGVKGEEELLGKGVSYCATCDGAFFRDKTVAVVGGGDVAIEDVIFLARTCKKVYLIHRRGELRGAKSLQEKMLTYENVEIIWNTIVTEIIGNEKVQCLNIKNIKTNVEIELLVDGIFVAVGILPNTELVKGIVPVDEQGYIKAGEDCVTEIKGIFAAGDIRTKALRQIVTAAADGANAVTSVQNHLTEILQK